MLTVAQLRHGMAIALTEEMNAKQWSVSELSARSGVSESTIKAVLKEKVDFRLSTIDRLFEPFGKSSFDAFVKAEEILGLPVGNYPTKE